MQQINNSLINRKEAGITAYLQNEKVRQQIINAVGNDYQRFITSIISAVSQNKELKECSNVSILNCALLGETLKLSPSPQLGQFFMIPYDTKQGKIANFQMGYKGYLQLAIRSGNYKKITVISIKEGELVGYNPLTEELDVNLIEDFDVRENTKTVGYYGRLEFKNGFSKAIYWNLQQMQNHAKKYSKMFSKDLQYGSKNSYWSQNFDAMAYKTVLKQLLSKWGILDNDLQVAFDADVVKVDKNDDSKGFEEINENSIIDKTTENTEKNVQMALFS